MSEFSDDIRDIADALQECANTIGAYLDESFNNITRAQYDLIFEEQKSLIVASVHVRSIASSITAAQLGVATAEIKSAIEDAQAVLKKLKDVGRIISFVTSLVDVAGGMIAGDPKATIKAVSKLIDKK